MLTIVFDSKNSVVISEDNGSINLIILEIVMMMMAMIEEETIETADTIEMDDTKGMIDMTVAADGMMTIEAQTEARIDIGQTVEIPHETAIDHTTEVRVVDMAATSGVAIRIAQGCHRHQKLHSPRMQLHRVSDHRISDTSTKLCQDSMLQLQCPETLLLVETWSVHPHPHDLAGMRHPCKVREMGTIFRNLMMKTLTDTSTWIRRKEAMS
mmetsp:Transcript_29851/g.71745  ORF Transcript_29851/g.71745 Transcript_29851/m.71745 type:complete len:211 (+) Transcript_29851:318-950(+)